MYAAITIISYISLFLLIVPPLPADMIQTAILFLLGAIRILWKRPWKNRAPISRAAYWCAGVPAAYFALRFYYRWLPSSKILSLATMLHIPHPLLIAVTGAVFAVCAVYSIASMLQRAAVLLKSPEKPLARDLLSCFVAAVSTVILAQVMIDEAILSMAFNKFLWGTVIVGIGTVGLYCLVGKARLCAALGTGFFMVLSTVNVYVFQFRGRLFEPVDIFSAGTAMNVADNYSLLPIPARILIGWGIWLALLLLWKFSEKKFSAYKPSGKQRGLLALGCLVCTVCVLVYGTHVKTYHWHKEGAEFNGYYLDFVAKFKEAYITKPEGYSREGIAELSNLYSPDSSNAKTPHVIVIMDEAFSDLSVNGEISTNVPVMPFISSLKENAVSGYAQASVYGGNTANSEFEFLTGNSMAWLSPNAVPYEQYVRAPSYSMVSYLKSHFDYRCIAMHPYRSDGWNRPNVYSHLGFDQQFFVEDFPQKKLVRNYVSDREMFETVVATYERYKDQPLFLFGVTMQNHGDYAYQGENFTPSVSLVGYENTYPAVEQYLSLIHVTDKAVQYLISYFESVEEDVVIVFFGDHQPKIKEAFYEEVCRQTADSLDEQMERYTVPFFVWANYDIEMRQVERTSLNYLSSYVYEVAGIPAPTYNRFLSAMEEKIPAINANGFYSLEQHCYLPFEMASEEEALWLRYYEQLQYNNLCDQRYRNSAFFPTLN